MSKVIKKRRFTAMETAVLGNILYLVIVVIFKGAIDIIGRDGNFNYIFNGIEFGVIGLFWIVLFANNFRKIYTGEKPRTIKYIFLTLIPIVLLTSALVLVSTFIPGEATNVVWNQFSFIAAPTIFWYLPFGVVYEIIGEVVPIFGFYGICLGITLIFQVIGVIIGRSMGKKYREETKSFSTGEVASMKKKKEKKNKKTVQVEATSENNTIEKMVKPEKQKISMTQVIINETPEALEEELLATERETESIPVFESIPQEEKVEEIECEETNESFGSEQLTPVTEYEVDKSKDEVVETIYYNEKEEKKEPPFILKPSQTKEDVIGEWEMTAPMDIEKIQEELEKHQENFDKSFFMETSQIRIISEEDIEEYYRNKK